MRLMSVIGVHPETHTVDLEDWRSGWRMMGAPVLTGPATGRTGLADLPAFSSESPGVAVVDTVDGSPVVMGFLHPRMSQLRFADGRAIWRHESDVYMTVGRDGDLEIHHPSGAMIRIGESDVHEDLSGADFDASWALTKSTGKDVKVTLQAGRSKIILSDVGIVIETPSLDINETP